MAVTRAHDSGNFTRIVGPLAHVSSAPDEPCLTIDPFGLVRKEKGGDGGEIGRPPDAPRSRRLEERLCIISVEPPHARFTTELQLRGNQQTVGSKLVGDSCGTVVVVAGFPPVETDGSPVVGVARVD